MSAWGCAAACVNGRFWCANAGFQSATHPSSRVGDGVCDCCDGSDEAAGACANTCEADGAEWRREQARHEDVVKRGVEERAKYAQRGREARAEAARTRDEALAGLDTARARQEAAKAAQAEAEKVEAEERERRGREGEQELHRSLGLSSLRAEELRGALVTLARRANASDVLEEVLRSLVAPGTVVVWPEGSPRGEEAGGAAEPFSTPEADAARKEVSDAAAEVARLEIQLKDADRWDGKDFGPDDAWRPLAERCIASQIQKYRYEVCPFERAQQDHTALGSFKAWKVPPAQARDGRFPTMTFEGGSRCWNGPARSIEVEFRCGVEDRIVSVDEPSTCVYTAVAETPAACLLDSSPPPRESGDEL